MADLINKFLEVFMKYVDNNYDLNVKNILLKKSHSIRVANIIFSVASEMNLSDDDIILAYKIGLCHDLGRFRETDIYNGKFNDVGFDHGACSNTILFDEGLYKEFDFKEDEISIVKKSLYYHNKKDIGNDLTDRELFFANLIRDCDKIDILKLKTDRKNFKFSQKPNVKVIDNFFNKRTTDIRDLHNETDWAILYFSFINTMCYDESFIKLEELGYIDYFINSLDVSRENKELFENILNRINLRREKVKKYGNER